MHCRSAMLSRATRWATRSTRSSTDRPRTLKPQFGSTALAGEAVERLSNDVEADAVRAGKGGNAQPLARNEFTAQELGTKVHEDPRHERTATFFGTHGALSIGRLV